MKVEIAFAGESRRRPRCRYNLHRVQPGPAIQAVITSDRPTIISYHWVDDGPVIHTKPVCLCSTTLLPFRERGYLGALIGHRDAEGKPVWLSAVLELTSEGLEAVQVIAGAKASLRGARIRAKRRDARKCSELLIDLIEWEPVEKLPAPLDVMQFVQGLWENFLPKVDLPPSRLSNDNVSWDDPGAEIPC